MPTVRCPSCSAPYRNRQTDALSTCEFCGAMLAVDAFSGKRLHAEPRFDGPRARVLTSRTLQRSGRRFMVGHPQLVFFPFAAGGSTRRPYAPLTNLPPSLERRWRVSAADLQLIDEKREHSTLDDAQVVMPPQPPKNGAAVVLYPFYRTPLTIGDSDSAAWVDAVDGQVMLPEDLLSSGPAAENRNEWMWWARPAAAGALSGLMLPFPLSLLATMAAGGIAWAGSTKW